MCYKKVVRKTITGGLQQPPPQWIVGSWNFINSKEIRLNVNGFPQAAQLELVHRWQKAQSTKIHIVNVLICYTSSNDLMKLNAVFEFLITSPIQWASSNTS